MKKGKISIGMDMDEYQKIAAETAEWGDDFPIEPIMYITLGLTGEAGEVANKIKKIARDDGGKITEKRKLEIKQELGDLLWYISQLAQELGISFSDVARSNLDKLSDRRERGLIRGDGDNR